MKSPWHPEHAKAEALRAEFAAEYQANVIRYSGYNVSRLLRSTGERPERIAEAREILDRLGLGQERWVTTGGIFDHGLIWSRGGKPWALIGHPYHIDDRQHELLAELDRAFPGLKVSIDDRPSYYGFGTRHVRIEVIETHRPYKVPPSTRQTRRIKRLFKTALEGANNGV